MKSFEIISKLIFPFIGLYVIYTAYSYADSLKNCSCISSLKPQIEHIKTFEQALMTLQVIMILLQIIAIVMPPSKLFAFTSKYAIFWVFGIYILAIIFIMIYFVSSVYDFAEQIPEDCKCAMKWQRNILYLQALLYTFSLFIICIVTLFILTSFAM